jgi:uncharacterized membrane protein HdeD (DUF308 family)
MNAALTTELVGGMASRSWMLVVRGAVAILFGVLTLAMPPSSLVTLLMLWGLYSIFDGVFCVLLASQRSIAGHTWGWFLFEGTVGLGAGFLALLTSNMSALAFLSLIAVRAAFIGIAEIAEAVRVRDAIRGEWLLAATGVLSVAFGITMLLYRGAGALAAASAIAVYATIFGALLIGLGMRIHHWHPSTP